MPMMRMPFTKKIPNKGEQPAAENEKTGENTAQENVEGNNENPEQKNVNEAVVKEGETGKKVNNFF